MRLLRKGKRKRGKENPDKLLIHTSIDTYKRHTFTLSTNAIDVYVLAWSTKIARKMTGVLLLCYVLSRRIGYRGRWWMV